MKCKKCGQEAKEENTLHNCYKKITCLNPECEEYLKPVVLKKTGD